MKQKIVLVEDDEAVSDVLTIILRSNDFDVVKFLSAEQCMGQPVQDASLFLIDLTLPGMNGIDLCKQLKHEQATRLIPIILISADFHIRLRSAECGAEAALDKPFSRLELLSRIRELVAPTSATH
jgi:DNA-binding response OmpR family regulator